MTGASSGIGKAIARQLAVSGLTTVAIARRIDKLIELQNELKLQNIDTLIPMKADITNKDEVSIPTKFFIKFQRNIPFKNRIKFSGFFVRFSNQS